MHKIGSLEESIVLLGKQTTMREPSRPALALQVLGILLVRRLAVLVLLAIGDYGVGQPVAAVVAGKFAGALDEVLQRYPSRGKQQSAGTGAAGTPMVWPGTPG
jgi:hypothetical protein